MLHRTKCVWSIFPCSAVMTWPCEFSTTNWWRATPPFHQPLAGGLDDSQLYFVGRVEAAPPGGQPLGLITTIAPALAQALDPRGTIALPQRSPAEPIVPLGCRAPYSAAQPECSDANLTWAPFAVLVPSKADVLGLGRRLAPLPIGHSTRTGRAAGPDSAVPTGVAWPCSRSTPLYDASVYRSPRASD
jgi:hypothetical protein